jgi:hypothetical protein
LFIGTWEYDFINGLRAYSEYALLVWPPSLISPWWGQVIVVSVVLCWSIWMFLDLRKLQHASQPVWIVSVAVIVSLLLLPQTGFYNLMFGLFPAWLMFWVMSENIFGWIPVLIVFFFPWIFHEILKNPSLEFIMVPFTLLVLESMYWLIWKKKYLLKDA